MLTFSIGEPDTFSMLVSLLLFICPQLNAHQLFCVPLAQDILFSNIVTQVSNKTFRPPRHDYYVVTSATFSNETNIISALANKNKPQFSKFAKRVILCA
jgi:hypothetical protein